MAGPDFSNFDAVLLDLDGTVYFEDHPLPGAVEFIGRLQKEGKKFACLSNSTSSPERVVKRFAGMGVKMESSGIYTAGMAAVDYVVKHFHGPDGNQPRVFNLATVGVQNMLQGKAIDVLGENEPCQAVIIGAPANVFATPGRQRMALRLLRNGAAAIGICADRIYPSPRGLEFGSGALSEMLAYAANVKPIYCGKPEVLFFNELCRRLGVQSNRCVLIGDNLESDIFGAKRVGMKTVLTLTGVTQRGDLEGLAADHQPDFVIEDLRELAYASC